MKVETVNDQSGCGGKAQTVDDLVINVDLKPSPRQSFDIRITWCVNCNLKAQAEALVAELKYWLSAHDVAFRLVEGSNSEFNVQCNGRTVFDRIIEGRFPMYHEIQMRMFRMFLKKEHLKESTQQKWERILTAKGLTWEQVFAALPTVPRAVSNCGDA
jgi:selT/selW/selH-like putative selenoprotein